VDVPSPRSRLGPAGPAGGALFGGVSKRPESAESIHMCGVDGPSPRIDLAPQQAPPYAGPFSAEPLDWRAPPAPTGGAAKGEQQQQKSNFGRRIAQTLLE
jgi:hypothetical protein